MCHALAFTEPLATADTLLRPLQSQLNSGAAMSEPMEVRVDVKDSGMMIVTTVTPEFRWQSGTAAIQLRVHGPLSSPTVCPPYLTLHCWSSAPSAATDLWTL